MGSNMQRQAVPLLKPHAPLVGTGIEHRIAVDSGEILVAQNPGVVDYVDGQTIIVLNNDGEYDEYLVPKFQRSNQSGCINHRPIVRKGDEVQAGDVLADGPSCDGGELALGQNLMVAYMPWEATTTRTPSSCPSAWLPKTCSRPSIFPNTRSTRATRSSVPRRSPAKSRTSPTT